MNPSYCEGKSRMSLIKRWLANPLTRGMDIDDPRTTDLRRYIIQNKPFLRNIYNEWYEKIVMTLPYSYSKVLEMGTGAGYLQDFIPDLITTDIFYLPGLSAVLDAQQMPFQDDILDAIIMIDVLHHIPQPRSFLLEAARCVREGGFIILNEPWVTAWSSLIYRNFHHEPFEPEAQDWGFPSQGPLSGANGAMPWIIFDRDREQFEEAFPQWRIRNIEPGMPFRYLLSGGVSMRQLMPSWSYPLWRGLEKILKPLRRYFSMFAFIVLERTEFSGKETGG